jgi:hypothetical protein
MALLVPVLVGAFFIWLAVRVSSLRQKLGRKFWIVAPLAVLMSIYPFSFGPACRLEEHGYISLERIGQIYSPILWLQEHGPGPLAGLVSMVSGETDIVARLKWERILQAINREQQQTWQSQRLIVVTLPAPNSGTTPESD